MKIKDYFLSQEEFELKESSIKGHLQTTPLPDDLNKYYESENYISHNQEKKNLFVRLYKIFQKHNLKYKLNLLNQFIPEKSKVLDYGCGSGDFLKFIENTHETYAYEPNENAQKILKTKIKSRIYNNLNQIETESLDAISLWHVLEHIPNQKEIIDNLLSKIKKNGVLIIAIPNHASYDAIYYKNFWAAYDVPRHLHHYTKNAFQNFCIKNNYNLIKIKPLIWDAFYISLLSEKYKKSKLKILKSLYFGTISNVKALKTDEFSSLIYVIRK